MGFKTKYINEKHPVTVVQGRYGNGETALQIVSEIGEQLAIATVNLEVYDEHPARGNVFIYGNYAVYEGLYEALHAEGVVGPIIRQVLMGGFDATAIECKLLLDNEVRTIIGEEILTDTPQDIAVLSRLQRAQEMRRRAIQRGDKETEAAWDAVIEESSGSEQAYNREADYWKHSGGKRH